MNHEVDEFWKGLDKILFYVYNNHLYLIISIKF